MYMTITPPYNMHCIIGLPMLYNMEITSRLPLPLSYYIIKPDPTD